jgi:hypothetical protein
MALTEMVKTYHEMYQELFKDAQNRVQKARENYQLAVERRAAAVHKADEDEVKRQVQQQEALNADLERLTATMQDLLARAKTSDETPMPVPIGYSVFNDDSIGIKFLEQNDSKETFVVTTKVTKIFNKAVKVDVRDMRKSSRRDRFEMAVNFILNFSAESVMKFMTADEFYQNRAAFVGKSGISSTYGRVNGPGIQDIKKSDKKGITFRMADTDILVQEPLGVSSDMGAIWKMASGAFEWFWYRKD